MTHPTTHTCTEETGSTKLSDKPNVCFDTLSCKVLGTINKNIVLLSPTATQAIQYFSDINAILNSLKIYDYYFNFLPINNCDEFKADSGTHWSPLFYLRRGKTFYYYG